MQILNGKQEAAEIVAGNGLVQSRHLPDNLKHLLSANILHQKENVLFIMKSFHETNDVRKNRFLQNLLFLNYT